MLTFLILAGQRNGLGAVAFSILGNFPEKAKLEEMGYEFVNTLFTDQWYSDEAMNERGVVQVPLCYLAKSLENMSLCHAAYFAKGWETARGCRIEHDVAVAYGLEVLYED